MTINVVVNGLDTSNQNNFYGTVGTTAVQILATSVPPAPAQGPLRQFLQVHNPTASAKLAFTTDGTTPVIGGAGVQVAAGASQIYNIKVPPGAVTIIADGASTAFTILSM